MIFEDTQIEITRQNVIDELYRDFFKVAADSEQEVEILEELRYLLSITDEEFDIIFSE